MPRIFPKFVHWSARIIALLVAAFFIFLIVGEFVAPHSRGPAGVKEWGLIILLVLSVIGMLLAWRWELPGAVLSLGALGLWASFVHIHRYPDVIALLAAPGLLFLSDWALHYGLEHHRHP
jgi:hypothetical protein